MITRTLWDVVCTTRTGDRECEAEANALLSEARADSWRDRHQQQTGHTRYLRVRSDYEDLGPTPPNLPPPGRPELRAVANPEA
ncbi:hypothetical protein [Streptomyces xiaopingdaonensis]|uniref:hypothetical protein n=1 Tax=Streptomyces xiaopingdaonensis TaxID=1565415 RepID=UPI0003149353|nr:hypothetical protein [Streptomyces xiaopingdaonensis]